MTSGPPSGPAPPPAGQGDPAIEARLQQALEAVGACVLGKRRQIELAFSCLLAGGHLLIEDLPGVGKTTLAKALARSLGLGFKRIQFTSDMLPADIVGGSVYVREREGFRFHPGPVFTQVVLADEVNRATPRAQSALLEAMEERQVSVEGESHPLPEPFFVIATQNPGDQIGTYALPESQLDRFTMRLALGFPDPRAERAMLRRSDSGRAPDSPAPCLDPAGLLRLQHCARTVHVSEALLDYLQALLAASRQTAQFGAGLSPRAGQALLRCARAWALVHGRRHVLPEDLQAVLAPVVDHRLPSPEAGAVSPGRHLLDHVAVP